MYAVALHYQCPRPTDLVVLQLSRVAHHRPTTTNAAAHLVRHAVGQQHHVPRVDGHAVPRHRLLDLVHDLGARRLDAL